MENFFYLFKDKNSIQFSDNFFILGWIKPRIFENYRTKDGNFIQKMYFHLGYVPNLSTYWINKSILRQIISQNCGCYLTKDKKVIRTLDRFFIFFIFEKIKKKLSTTHGQGLYVLQHDVDT